MQSKNLIIICFVVLTIAFGLAVLGQGVKVLTEYTTSQTETINAILESK